MLSASNPAEEILRRNRAKILQHAVQLREGDSQMIPGMSLFIPLRRLVSSLAILLLLIASGTSLVGAASTSLPGDDLYPVKRSWERLQLTLTLDGETRTLLEVDHENERIEELRELFAGNRSAEVEFNGLLTSQNGNDWLVAGIRVVITPDTDLPSGQLQLKSAVQVHGWTQTGGSVLAAQIELLDPGASLPDIEDESGEDGNQPEDGNLGPGSGEDAPMLEGTITPEAEEIQFDGILNIRDADFWTINGMPSDISNAEVEGTPAVGAAVTVEGYFNADGIFIVTRIRFEEIDTNSGSDSNSNTNSNDNTNDNDNDDSNDNDDNGDDGHNDNGDDGDNSGSGGGGDD
jgi:hypothetical protein